ncbi:MAG: hypothetical protein QMB89_00165, partial [Flavobacteriales bacterium]
MSDNKKKPLTSKKSTSKKKSTSNSPIPQKDSGKNVNFYWIYAVVGVLLLGMIMLNSDGGGSEIQFSEFKSYVESDDVDHVIHDGHVYKVYLTESAKEDLVGSSDDDSRGIMGLYAGPDVWFSMPPG